MKPLRTAPALPPAWTGGSELLAINGQTIASLLSSGGSQAVIDALGPLMRA